MRRGRIAPVCAALLLAPSAAAAQWTVEASAGRAVHDPVSARVAAASASLGLGYARADRWGYLAGGVPLGGGGPGWGAAGGGGWAGVRRGALAIGVSAGAHAYGHGRAGPTDAGSGGSAALLAGASLLRGPLTAELRSGIAAAGEAAGDSTGLRRFHETAARLALDLPAGATVAGEARLLRGEGGEWPYAGATAEARRPWGGAWAHAGSWLGAGRPAPAAAYGAGVRVRVAAATELQGALRQEPYDPLYRSAARRSWSVSLVRSLGGGRGRAPAGAPRVAVGEAEFRVPRAPSGEAPALIGDFSGWEPVEMRVEGAWWVARVRLAPGVHHYAFRGADGRVFVPPGVAAVDDGFGGRSGVVVVP